MYPADHEGAVARYYERNTSFFLRLGKTAATHNIHRCVWGPGVADRGAAAQYVNALALEQLQALDAAAPRVLDLGCGVGAGLLYLGERMAPGALAGVTISPTQAGRHEVAIHSASFPAAL